MPNNVTREEVAVLNKILKAVSAKEFTPSHLETTTTGTIQAGFHKVSFYNAGVADADITINGITIQLPSGASHTIDGGYKGDISKLPVTYDATGTTLLISQSRI